MRCLIVGCQRSGTTLLRHVLSAGSMLIFDENWIATYLYRERFHANNWRGHGWDYDDEDTIIWDKKAQLFLWDTYHTYFRKLKAPRHVAWGMKSPGFNMACAIPYMAKLFASLKFIYLVRDPRDTFASMERSEKMMNNLPRHFNRDSINSPDLVDLSQRPYEYWAAVNSEIIEHSRNMPDRFYTLRFEEWMEDPVANTRAVCDFLNISFSTSMIEPFTQRISRSSVVSMSKDDYESGNIVIQKTAVDRWKRDLSPEQAKKVIKYSADVAQELGYVT